jgi:monoamine oxidase
MGSRVLVVGAGLGGLAAAYELCRHGYEVSIFEASSSVGGRARSRNDVFPQMTLEMGAEFIGKNHPRWCAYAKSFGIELAEIVWPDTSAIILAGQAFTGQRLADLKVAYHRLQTQLTKCSEVVDDEYPWRSSDADELDRVSLAEGIAKELHGEDLAKRLLLLKFHQSEAAPPETISWLGQLTVIKGHGLNAYWEDTEHYRCRGGVQQLADAFASRLPNETIRCNAVAARISIFASGVALDVARGETFDGDWLLLAIPPSQWSNIVFSPTLPQLPELKVGAASKEFIRLARPFWQGEHAPRALCDLPQGGLYQTGTDRSADSQPCLEWYVAGAPAETVVDLSAADRKRRIQAAMEPTHPGLSANWLDWYAQDWVNDPFTKGAYSFAQLGKITHWGTTLYHGLGRLKFVGEHASFRYTGYMEGALESAERCARQIILENKYD